MILAFLLPYGLIAAELGTAYAGDGGLYDWIHAAYPDGKWAAHYENTVLITDGEPEILTAPAI